MNGRSCRLLVAIGALALASAAPAADDWQYWNQLVLKHEFTDRLALDVASEQKWSVDPWDLFQYNTTLLPTVSVTDNVSVGVGYRYERKEQGEEWMTENRLLFPLTFGWALNPWQFQLRSQLEYRDLEDDQDRWRIRERILLKRPVRIGEVTVTPFISEEVFYDFTVEQMNQNRAAVGLSAPWGKHTTLSVFYMSKADRRDHWSTVNVLGTEVAVKF
jgi:hypothetical protein